MVHSMHAQRLLTLKGHVTELANEAAGLIVFQHMSSQPLFGEARVITVLTVNVLLTCNHDGFSDNAELRTKVFPVRAKRCLSRHPHRCWFTGSNEGGPPIELPTLWGTWVQMESLLMTHSGKC